MAPSVDIFCRVIDNYGDIGVCWRLARQLAARPDCGAIRLWVDDLDSFARIAPQVQSGTDQQELRGIGIFRWGNSLPDTTEPADIVIEAFGCTLPFGYLEHMSAQQLWLNLEYLSTEDWAESCHGLPSLQPNGLRKFFFFPGFTPATGGLLREPGLIARRDAWQADSQARLTLLNKLGVSPAWLERLQAGARLVYVYCYPQAPLPALMRALSRQGHDSLVMLPQGIWPDALPSLHANGCRIETHAHPFVDQDTFDQLLWSSDLNLVRGEDSLVRAIWAGRPMIWQPYLQQEETHLEKLAAWLAQTPWPEEIQQAILAWNQGDSHAFAAALTPLLHPQRLQQWQTLAQQWCTELTQTNDLATRLLAFCTKNSQTS